MVEQAPPPENVDVDEQKARKKRYKKSLNLPKTAFPMKANLRQNEPHSRVRWQKSDLYHRVLQARSDADPFVFHDGPPYANGSIHVGHLLNKVLKDLVVRTKTLNGKRCPYVPGWDCHGLPIEHKVMTELQKSGALSKIETLETDRFHMAVRRACADYARKFKKIQAEGMQRLLTLADYDEPYMTLDPLYEQGVLEVFAELVEQGLVYRDLKPVHWSIANQTALAEAELEYFDREDTSIYVWFDAVDAAELGRRFDVDGFEGVDQASFMIWTTTPWTLPANLLVAIHPRWELALVRLGDRVGVLAEGLIETVARAGGIDPASVEILGKTTGSDLLGLEYRHPFANRVGRVVEADYVSLEDGTGLVHTAPGHGAEDYATGLEEGVDIYCPVQADGTYDDTVPEWLRGMSIWDANGKIVECLQRSGHLFHAHAFQHSYPHDWRSKTPVVFRATEQWFIGVDRPTRHNGQTLRQLALDAASDKVVFVPEWGRNRMLGMLESRPDWCLSRQRSWGLPIPAFRCPDGTVFLTAASVRAVAGVYGADGSDCWFESEPPSLLRDYDPSNDPDAPEAVRNGTVAVADLTKTYDIFDVWFESGSSWNSVVRERELGYPTDLYLEGSDQHRGWFQASLLPALGVTGESPFRELLTHGFMVDRDGRKMSKSQGNALEVEDLLRDYGADVCRWWVSSIAYEADFKVDRAYFDVAGDAYRKVRNTLRFLLGNLQDFDPAEHAVDLAAIAPTSLDAWALAAAMELRAQVLDAYERYDFRQANLLLFNFCNDTLSATYLDSVKDRLYCDRADSTRRRQTQTVLYELAQLLPSLLAPILPHTADEAYRALLGEEAEIHLQTCHPLAATADPRWAEVLRVREGVDRALEQAKASGLDNPLDTGIIVPAGALADFREDLPDLLGVSRVELAADAAAIEVVDLREQPRCERSWRRDATVRLRSDGGWLSDRDALAVGMTSATQ